MPAKVHLIKAMVFPVVMYRYDSWTIKKTERQRIYAFEPGAGEDFFFFFFFLRRPLRVPWSAGKSNQSILKQINSRYSLEGLMLKLEYFGHICEELTHWKRPRGKDWRQEEKGATEDEMVGWHDWLSGHEFEQTPGDSEGQGSLGRCIPWNHKELNMT